MNRSLLGLAFLSVGIALPLRSDPQPLNRQFTGVALPSRTIHLGAAADGLLSEVRVERGDRVQAGQVVATLDFDVQKATVRLAKARTESVANLESARTKAKQAAERLDQRLRLVAEGLVTEDETNVFRTNARLAELDAQMAEENKRLAELEYERSNAQLKQGILISPIDGIVTERFLSAGEVLSKSGAGEVVSLAQLDPLMIELHVPLELFQQLSVGQTAKVRFLGIDLGTREAELVVMDQVIDTASDTFRVALKLDNPELAIPAGLRAEVEFELE